MGDEIGRGATGIVYSAKSTETGRTYAAKKLAIEDASINEICVLTQLKKHPNIVEFRESKLGRDGETQVLFVISEFCPLGNIGDYILKQQVDVVTKRNLAVQLADAITFLHKNGIVHCDIKPQNVLLTGNEAHLVLKVVDFGLAKVLTGSENSVNNLSRSYMKSAVGTRFYLSPEIYQCLLNDQPCHYTSSVDIFSMGMLLWAMFDGLSILGSCQQDRYLTPFTGSETDPMPVAQALTQGNIELNFMESEQDVRCKNLVC
ncbi:serine/threonine-protein kinase 35-like [Branchiostoma floridae]|uniref:Serine/threonine-protein kinase 35-like n=1 Tax=Branchiostoma floridae TaxID=7739 RepID=A0A9J7MEI0_BRAFL|nr:serine/threonine-protein kinase 35-like [Branchiostoma floridae]